MLLVRLRHLDILLQELMGNAVDMCVLLLLMRVLVVVVVVMLVVQLGSVVLLMHTLSFPAGRSFREGIRVVVMMRPV